MFIFTHDYKTSFLHKSRETGNINDKKGRIMQTTSYESCRWTNSTVKDDGIGKLPK